MPRIRHPRSGSMQFWPRVRSKTNTARIRNWEPAKDVKPLGFAGYKVGMTHAHIQDNRTHSLTKNTDIFCPITIVECPPLKTISIKFYKETKDGTKLISELIAETLDKEISRKITTPKKKGKESTTFDFVRLLCYTQPKLTTIGTKKPETFEIAIGGKKEDQLKYAKEKLGKEITINDVFKEGQQLDSHTLTKGKGFQGAMKRFGISLRHHKSEKSRRNPGSLGAWQGQGHIMWRTAHAGKTGNYLRTEYNKWILKIGDKGEEVNAKGGHIKYGEVKNQYVLIKGSLSGSKKRLIKFTNAKRPKKNVPGAPQIKYLSQESKQGK
jgi:large subunit ribosomal protein L3